MEPYVWNAFLRKRLLLVQCRMKKTVAQPDFSVVTVTAQLTLLRGLLNVVAHHNVQHDASHSLLTTILMSR
jgi:hypothetical protein